MRNGSNFSGTEEELQKAMKENLEKFTSNIVWLEDIQQEVSEQEFINICESLAECVDRGYLNDTKYLILGNKTIAFMNKTLYAGDPPEDALKPFTLSESGKMFLGIEE